MPAKVKRLLDAFEDLSPVEQRMCVIALMDYWPSQVAAVAGPGKAARSRANKTAGLRS